MREPNQLVPDEIEAIEKLCLRALFTAALDFGFDAWEVFHQSSDEPKDVAEDTTREMLDRLGGYGISQRIYGDVDYRKARYVILPDFSVRQALFVDSKAEKEANNATLQVSQLSQLAGLFVQTERRSLGASSRSSHLTSRVRGTFLPIPTPALPSEWGGSKPVEPTRCPPLSTHCSPAHNHANPTDN